MRYIAVFLPQLAEQTAVLTPLTTKAADKMFPQWMRAHEEAFNRIRELVLSRECQTTIDHDNLGDNTIFVMTDASERRTGAVLSVGPSWELSQPVAFDSQQLLGPSRRYPTHEKELLAIVCTLKKWRCDLLGAQFVVYTDHHTLKNFMS